MWFAIGVAFVKERISFLPNRQINQQTSIPVPILKDLPESLCLWKSHFGQILETWIRNCKLGLPLDFSDGGGENVNKHVKSCQCFIWWLFKIPRGSEINVLGNSTYGPIVSFYFQWCSFQYLYLFHPDLIYLGSFIDKHLWGRKINVDCTFFVLSASNLLSCCLSFEGNVCGWQLVFLKMRWVTWSELLYGKLTWHVFRVGWKSLVCEIISEAVSEEHTFSYLLS